MKIFQKIRNLFKPPQPVLKSRYLVLMGKDVLAEMVEPSAHSQVWINFKLNLLNTDQWTRAALYSKELWLLSELQFFEAEENNKGQRVEFSLSLKTIEQLKNRPERVVVRGPYYPS